MEHQVANSGCCNQTHVVHIPMQSRRSWPELYASSTRSSFYIWKPCSSEQNNQVYYSIDYPVANVFRNYCCFDMLPFVCAHFATLSLGVIFRKQKLSILWKGGTLKSPQIVHSEINCESLKNLIQYFYRKFFENLTIFILFNLYQMYIWMYFSLSGTETSWVLSYPYVDCSNTSVLYSSNVPVEGLIK